MSVRMKEETIAQLAIQTLIGIRISKPTFGLANCTPGTQTEIGRYIFVGIPHTYKKTARLCRLTKPGGML